MDAAAELGAHRSLAAGRSQDQPDGLLELPVGVDEGDSAGGIGTEGVGPAGADEIAVGSCGGWRRRHDQPPIRTVGAPITIGAPQPDMSPMRAAGLPPISTVGQPGGMIVVGG